MSTSHLDLLKGNESFVEELRKMDPEFFTNLAKGQKPEYLWIGCSDSRVPESVVTKAKPGGIFVHRNIANVVVATDANLLSVAYYAVKVLKVKHVIVCGHYGCGGVNAAMGNKSLGYIDGWLRHIKDVYRLHQDELDAIEDEEQKFKRYVELNVIEQVNNLAAVDFIQSEWENGEYPIIHGWVFDLGSGKIVDLDCDVKDAGSLVNPLNEYA